jgi:hypothetical protein
LREDVVEFLKIQTPASFVTKINIFSNAAMHARLPRWVIFNRLAPSPLTGSLSPDSFRARRMLLTAESGHCGYQRGIFKASGHRKRALDIRTRDIIPGEPW